MPHSTLRQQRGGNNTFSPWGEPQPRSMLQGPVRGIHPAATRPHINRRHLQSSRGVPARPSPGQPQEAAPPPQAQAAAICCHLPPKPVGGRAGRAVTWPRGGRARGVASRDARGHAPFPLSPLPSPVLRRGGRRARARARALPPPPPPLHLLWHVTPPRNVALCNHVTWKRSGGGREAEAGRGGGCVRDGAGCEDGGRGGRAGER